MFETNDGVRIKGFNLSDVVGRNIVCEDGVTRRVEQISHSFRFADKVLINEINEDETPGGAWVHILSLGAQMHGEPLPTKAQKQACSRVFESMRFVPTEDVVTPGFIKLPSGLVVKPK